MPTRNQLQRHRLRRQALRKQLRAQQLRRHQQWHLLSQLQLPLPLLGPLWPLTQDEAPPTPPPSSPAP